MITTISLAKIHHWTMSLSLSFFFYPQNKREDYINGSESPQGISMALPGLFNKLYKQPVQWYL